MKSLKTRLILLSLAFASILWGFQDLFLYHAPNVFNDKLEDMSFGWFIPIFSLYVVWRERKKIFSSLSAPSLLGFLLILPCLAIGFLGVRGTQIRLEILSVATLCITIPWALFGKKTAKAVLFPSLFLLFCLPLATFLDVITVHLRLLATQIASGTLFILGADVVRTGSTIAIKNGSFAIDIADPCSGLRSLFALMALSAGYAYFFQPTWLRRAILFATSIPLAILGNIVRILTICLISNYASEEFGMGFYHDYSGYIVFLVAIFLMVGCSEIITKIFPAPKQKSLADSTSESRASNFEQAISFLSVIIVATVMILQAQTPIVKLMEAPELALQEIRGFKSEEVEVSEAEKTVLPSDTKFIKRLYTAENGAWFQVSIVIGGATRNSIHRPELCLPSQGHLMTNPRTLKVNERNWRAITLGENKHSLGFTYTFFNQDGFNTASHTYRILKDVWDRSILLKADRWVMVTINAASADDRFLKYIISEVDKNLP